MRLKTSAIAIALTCSVIFYGLGTVQSNPLYGQNQDQFVYLPLVSVPNVSPELINGSFEEGWTDLPPAPGNLINQQPNGWVLEWVEPGEPLYDAPNDLAEGVPECVHKLASQLPPDEQPGGPNALILDGETTYKIFNASAAFGAQLTQTVSGLTPGVTGRLTVPIQLHVHDQPADPYSAESGAWVNGDGQWANREDMGDRQWYEHVVEFTVPDDGVLEITIRVKSKWSLPRDFFIDAVQLDIDE